MSDAFRTSNSEASVEHFLSEAISNSPQPLKDLADFLSSALSEDDWKTADRLLLALALRTQAPDSWRPEVSDMARAIYDAPTRFDGDAVGTHLGRSEMVDCSARTAEEEREIVLCMCEDAASAILALRPQTAESGK